MAIREDHPNGQDDSVGGIEQEALEALEAIERLLASAGKRPSLPSRLANWFGRALFGTMSLLAALGFGSFATAICILGNPVGPWQILAHWLIIDCFFLATIFLLLATLSFWAIGGQRSQRLLDRLTLKAAIIIMIFGLSMTVLAFFEVAR